MASAIEETCLQCRYTVTGIADRCPECGAGLPLDRTLLRPGMSTPWSERWLAALWPGVMEAVRHPRRSGEACQSAGRVRGSRAAIMAATVSLIIVAIWPIVRNLGLFASVAISERSSLGRSWSYLVVRSLGRPGAWTRLWQWELWSLARWWILFAALASALVWLRRLRTTPSLGARPLAWRERGPIVEALCRVALFSPWMLALELGYLAGVWLDDSHVVPEPSTIFVTTPRWDSWLRTVWLWRGVAPSVLVGLVFFRGTLGWRWRTAVIGAAVLVPLAINWSIVWSWLWLKLVLPWL